MPEWVNNYEDVYLKLRGSTRSSDIRVDIESSSDTDGFDIAEGVILDAEQKRITVEGQLRGCVRKVVLTKASGPQAAPAHGLAALKEVGCDLYEKTLGCRLAFHNACVGARGKRLRVRVAFLPSDRRMPELAALPWESMATREPWGPLAWEDNKSLVRELPWPNPIKALRVVPPLRILVVVSNPPRGLEAYDLEPVEAELEWQGIQAAEKRSQRLRPERLDNPTLQDVVRELERFTFHMVHFIGHGLFENNVAYLLFRADNELGYECVSPDDFALALQGTPVRMVLLNACLTASPYNSIATRLVADGIPVVVGMQLPVTDRAARDFSEAFYWELAATGHVDRAMFKGRKMVKIASTPTAKIEWATPVLYLASKSDGQVFELQPLEQSRLKVKVTATPSSTVEHRPITLLAEASGGCGEYQYTWSCDPAVDQALANQPEITVPFPKSGNYIVTCTVTDAAGDTAQNSVPVDISPAPDLLEVPKGIFTCGGDKAQMTRLLEKFGLPIEHNLAVLTEEAVAKVNLPTFWIGRYPVTNAQYREFIRAGNSQHMPKEGWQPSDPFFDPALGDHPVTQITWDDAAAYARWAGLRLLTALEWEKAARGTDGRLYPWGNAFDPQRCVTNENYQDDGHTEPVASNPNGVSPYGCQHMVGNVLEWTATTEGDFGVIKGGSFRMSCEVFGLPHLLQKGRKNVHRDDLGFRCAADRPPAAG